MSQPSTIIATNGMLADNGLSNTFVNTLFADVYNTSIISKAQQAISDADGVSVDISDLGNDIFPGVVGNVPTAYTTVTPTSSLRSAYYAYAQLLNASGSIPGFAGFFQQAQGYATQCFTIMEDIVYKESTSITDYGAKTTKQSHISTSGISGFLTVNNSANLTALGNDFVDLGTVFDYSDLDLYGTARGLSKQIIEKDLVLSSKLTQFIDDLNLNNDIDYYDPQYEDLMYDILVELPITTEFYQAFSYKPNVKIKTVADILDPSKAMRTTSDVLQFSSFTEVADSLSTFSQLKIKSNIEFGDLIKSLTTSGDLADLDGIVTVLPSDIQTSILSKIGEGQGVYGQPTVEDIIGPVSGSQLEERLDRILTALTIISASSDGTSIIEGYDNIIAVAADGGGGPYVVTGVGAGSYASKALAIAAIETALDTYYTNLRTFAAISSETLRESCETVYNDYDAIAKQVSDSKSLATKAGIDTANPSTNKASVLAFASSLETIGADVNNLGGRQLLLDMVDSDLTGDAIKASLIAGQNNVNLRKKGLLPKSVQG